MRRPLALLAALCTLLAAAQPARAQLEGALMPGPVAQAHAKLEHDCRACHVPFDKAAQDRLCLDCHKPVAADVAGRRGHHGRIDAAPCRRCHTEHKGRAVSLAAFDAKRFDHAQTDFALREAHTRVACEGCHRVGAKWREAPGACAGCHRQDDVHQGGLGAACADCHGEARWRDTRFDHGRTGFALRDRHALAKCAACHKSADYKAAPSTCVGCHRKDDRHKGRYGEKCQSCHDAADWKRATFDHDATRFALRGRHSTARCDACHTGHLYRDKPESACASCHRKDDKHLGTLGPRCGDCHGEQDWKRTRGFDHARTRFPLEGRHAKAECRACHRDNASLRDTPAACAACHRKDDAHKGRYGERCEGCHADTGWKAIRFAHDRDTPFPLRGAHRTVRCDACHAGTLYRDKAPTQCAGCHEKHDEHRGQLGRDCAACHGEAGWKGTRFDHGRSRFPLLGRHAPLECKACHASLAFRDAKAECDACHRKDDPHRGALGARCGTCHNARDWRAWDFHHDRATKFVLDGAHAPLACAACHRPGTASPRLPVACAACHGKDDVHEGRFGRACERCHETSKFTRIRPGMGQGARP